MRRHVFLVAVTAILCASNACASISTVQIGFDGVFASVGPGGAADFHLDFIFDNGDDDLVNNGWNRFDLLSLTMTSGGYWANLWEPSQGTANVITIAGVQNSDLDYGLLRVARHNNLASDADSLGGGAALQFEPELGSFQSE